jgi:hypothetical protein
MKILAFDVCSKAKYDHLKNDFDVAVNILNVPAGLPISDVALVLMSIRPGTKPVN